MLGLVQWISAKQGQPAAEIWKERLTVGCASLIIGVLSLAGVLVALVPLLNILNCIVLPTALLGAILGLAELVSYRAPGEGRGAAIFGLLINGLALLIGLVRFLVSLFTTGGIL
jgi:hypothetical protein